MANYYEHKCLACGQSFDYCRRCVLTPVAHKEEGFCSENCSHIFEILSKHGCGLATTDETIDALLPYDTTNLVGSVKSHMNSLKPSKKAKAQKEVETPTQE